VALPIDRRDTEIWAKAFSILKSVDRAAVSHSRSINR
jgi:hypothetical protein